MTGARQRSPGSSGAGKGDLKLSVDGENPCGVPPSVGQPDQRVAIMSAWPARVSVVPNADAERSMVPGRIHRCVDRGSIVAR